MQQGQVERVIYVGVDTGGTEVERTFFPTSRRGCAEMLAWAHSRRRGGPLRRGVHGDLRCRSCFKHLSREHVQVVEMSTPDRTVGGSRGKDDAAMAHKAAIEQIRSLIVSAPDTVCDQ